MKHSPSKVLLFLLPVALAVSSAVTGDSSRAPATDTAPSAVHDSARVRTIVLHGNDHTDSSVVRYFLGIDTGQRYDTATAAAARRRLKETDLFTKVHLFPSFKPDGVDLHVILVEAPRLMLSDIGGEFVEGRYGLERYEDDWWLRAGIGFLHRNVGGRMERLHLKLGFFRDRYIHLSWAKRFIGTPYFVSFGAGASRRPDLHVPLDRVSVYQTSTVGRYLGQRSKVYATLMPSFSSRTRADLKPSEFTVPADVHLYNAIHEESFQELLFLIGWSTSLGEHLGYDPSHGMRFGVTTRTNALWPRDEDHGYFQLDTENRFYHPGFTKESRFAYRLATTMRLDTAGLYDGLYAGGLGGPRGWGESALGAGAAYVANNRVLTSVEYRFPLFTTPTISFDKLAQFHEGLREFYYRLDGAFFIDGAFLWHRLEEPMHGDSEWGLGVGAGLRVMAPTLRRAVSLDFGWSIGPGSRWREIKRLAEYEASRTRHYARHKADSRLEKVANRAWASYLAASPYLPVAHLYLDLPF